MVDEGVDDFDLELNGEFFQEPQVVRLRQPDREIMSFGGARWEKGILLSAFVEWESVTAVLTK